MANISGNAYALTVLSPIKNGCIGDSSYQISYADEVQSRLHGLGVCEDSPLAKVPQTYLARFFILDDVFYESTPGCDPFCNLWDILSIFKDRFRLLALPREDHLKSRYLVFSSNFHGDLETLSTRHVVCRQRRYQAYLGTLRGLRQGARRGGFHRLHQTLPAHGKSVFQWFDRRSSGRAIEGPLSEAAVREIRRQPPRLGGRGVTGRLSGVYRAGAAEPSGGADMEARAIDPVKNSEYLDMTQQLDLPDIQGNIIRAYGRFGFPKARFFFLKINDGDRGRDFVGTITKRVTTSVSWGPPPKGVIPKPKAPINIAFTYNGLKALGLPRASLAGFPEEFAMGMKARKDDPRGRWAERSGTLGQGLGKARGRARRDSDQRADAGRKGAATTQVCRGGLSVGDVPDRCQPWWVSSC